MIVNALVHRDYQIQEPIDIVMTPEEIETLSPGGLTDEVAAKTGGQDIEMLIRDGSRGELKGYRNPVISNLFYEGSEMDRKGFRLIRHVAEDRRQQRRRHFWTDGRE